METELILSFITLTLLEIVLGIDNLIFIALIAGKLPKEMRAKVRFIGLTLALVIRVAMLMGVSWIMQLTEPLFHVGEMGISVRDMLLIGGGIFLIAKSTIEMHADVAGRHGEGRDISVKTSYAGAIMQVVAIDFVFSFDSIITAVGLTTNLPIIVAAVVISMVIMLLASGWVSHFLEEYPTFKMLALSFILMIGTLLVAEGLEFHVPKGYIYFAFGFSMGVEILNSIAGSKRRKAQEKKEP